MCEAVIEKAAALFFKHYFLASLHSKHDGPCTGEPYPCQRLRSRRLHG